jgi:hypothetical protein
MELGQQPTDEACAVHFIPDLGYDCPHFHFLARIHFIDYFTTAGPAKIILF